MTTGQAELEIAVFDWTESRPPSDDVEVLVEGADSWFPNLEFDGDSRSFGEFDVGVPGTFVIYPDGRGDAVIEVGFIMTDEMVPVSGSAQSLTQVDIFDSSVEVWGMAISKLELVFDR